MIFNDRHSSPMEIATKDADIITFFMNFAPSLIRRPVVQEVINREIPWGYFDGATRGDPVRCGGGVVFFLNEKNYLHIQAGFGVGTNHFAELLALRLLLTKA